jgi:uncharacterized protein involved in exopolysaccharide biosynthesis
MMKSESTPANPLRTIREQAILVQKEAQKLQEAIGSFLGTVDKQTKAMQSLSEQIGKSGVVTTLKQASEQMKQAWEQIAALSQQIRIKLSDLPRD